MRWTYALACACIAVGAFAWGWSWLARQAPSSPWYVQGYPSAIDHVALRAWIEGILVLVVAPHVARSELVDSPRRAWTLVAVAFAGTVIAFGAQFYAARTGNLGLQLRLPDGTTGWIRNARVVGDLLSLVALGDALRWSFRGNLRSGSGQSK